MLLDLVAWNAIVNLKYGGRPLNFVGRLCPWFLLHSCIKSFGTLLCSECDGATMISAIVMNLVVLGMPCWI